MKRNCIFCKREFEALKDREDNLQKFCSKKCRNYKNQMKSILKHQNNPTFK